ncbi:MAG: hypothetical protein OEV72_04295 [Thermoleophilia bacterium]|nr:hypothetical protein [Thermoleophilia bacterium]MDH5333478.1 hypothetical protein [Thermoleophilia bacterium]
MLSVGKRGPRLVCLLIAGLLGVVAPAAARDGKDDREARVTGVCRAGVTVELKVKADDGRLEVELEVDQNRAGVVWRVALVHERRLAWRGSARTRRPSGSFEVRRLLPDLAGSDTVTARAWGPGGITCRATVTLQGPWMVDR